jgi:hypothetical protein
MEITASTAREKQWERQTAAQTRAGDGTTVSGIEFRIYDQSGANKRVTLIWGNSIDSYWGT